jgi:hypothetical protein
MLIRRPFREPYSLGCFQKRYQQKKYREYFPLFCIQRLTELCLVVIKKTKGSMMKCIGVFAMIVVCGVLTSCQKDAVETVNDASSSSDLGLDASNKVFPKVLDAIDRNPKDENAWKALYRYRTFTDAGDTLEYYRDCFHFFVIENPSLLFERSSAGDAQAETLMKGIFKTYDPIAFTGEFVASAAAGFRRNRDILLKKKPETEMGNQFVREFSAQCDQWARNRRVSGAFGVKPTLQ